MVRRFRAHDFPPERVLAAKAGRRVSVCLPARDEEATVGALVATLRRALIDEHPVIDELVVVDDGSSDATADQAAAAGARVVPSGRAADGDRRVEGKGRALWQGLRSTDGDVVVFCDADIRHFDPGFILGLAGPLLAADDVDFVKGSYQRPLDGRPGEGGRVTELMARPLVSALFPHLAGFEQPLSGEMAAWRSVLEAVPFVGGYGVDLGLLIDVSAHVGPAGVVECDLGERVHRNRTLGELSAQALAVLEVALVRAGVASGEQAEAALPPGYSAHPGWPDSPGRWTVALQRPGADPVPVTFSELPPLSAPAARWRSA